MPPQPITAIRAGEGCIKFSSTAHKVRGNINYRKRLLLLYAAATGCQAGRAFIDLITIDTGSGKC